MKQMLRAIEDYSFRGLIFRITAKGKIVYLFKWAITAFTCYLFYSAVVLSALAGLFVLINLILTICQEK